LLAQPAAMRAYHRGMFTTATRFVSQGRWLVAAGLLAAALPASALFKVIAPDGSITYTDQPPTDPTSRVVAANPRGLPLPAADTAPALPADLKGVAARYPVTLYTSPDCAPCVSARLLLNRRGIPYAERSVSTPEDVDAFSRTVGSRMLPSLMVGKQALVGLSESDWQSYLDAAGYPRESRLPSNYRQPPAAPVVAGRPAADTPPAETTAVVPPPDNNTAPAPATPPQRNPLGIRF
jgi:glutaredoxin